MDNGFSNLGLRFEGEGSVPPVPKAYVWESVGENPFGSSEKHGVAVLLESWLNASQDVRYSDSALQHLKSELKKYKKKEVQRVLKESFHGSVLREIRDAMEACGLLPPAQQDEVGSLNDSIEVDTAEGLLREAVLHIPEFDTQLRERIGRFLSRGIL